MPRPPARLSSQAPEVDVRYRLRATDFPPMGGRRRDEVVMVIRRRSGAFLLMHKESYPEDAFRLPTGGLKRGEKPLAALHREAEEETNLTVSTERYLGRLFYLAWDRPVAVFSSHVFLAAEVSGEFGTNDASEGIDAWREVELAGVLAQAERLEALDPPAPDARIDWRRWGCFRALGHRFVHAALTTPAGTPTPRTEALLGPTGFAEFAV